MTLQLLTIYALSLVFGLFVGLKGDVLGISTTHSLLLLGKDERRHVFCDGAVTIDYPNPEYKNYLAINCLTITPPSASQPTPTVIAAGHPGSVSDGSMAMTGWQAGSKNPPNPNYDKCDDGTDVSLAHNQYYVIAYDGYKYPTWHPPVVTNPVTGSGKCYFGHEHGTNPQSYQYWQEIVEHFGTDHNGDGKITKMTIDANGKITPGDRAGIPFGIANEHMEKYYNQENRDSLFVRHEDHVGHKIEFVNGETDLVGRSTHVMGSNATGGINIPYYEGTNSNVYKPTGVLCTHFHKFHQGTHSGDALRNNLHEVIFHSTCTSTRPEYPGNTVILTGMMAFGNPGEYIRFCGKNRTTKICVDGKNADGSCKISDPLINKLPNSIHSNTLGRNLVDRYCLENVETLTGGRYFSPYEIWQGDLRVSKSDGKMLAEHGRQWDVLDPIRFADPGSVTGYSYNSLQCEGLLKNRTLNCGAEGNTKNQPWDSPQSGFRGLKRTTYFGRNRLSNPGGSQVWWTDPLGGHAVTTQFASGLKQKISAVEANICKLPECSRLNDRAIQRMFDDGGHTVHAPN